MREMNGGETTDPARGSVARRLATTLKIMVLKVTSEKMDFSTGP
jgi:hypothetical protein